jgi:hypothetical protein
VACDSRRRYKTAFIQVKEYSLQNLQNELEDFSQKKMKPRWEWL